jgi:hypothetical protein
MSKNEITIDGIEYVRKDSIKPSQKKIVRTYSAGVFFGEIESRNGMEVVMVNVRRLWYWDGAASLSQLSMEGTSKPNSCKFPCIENRKELTQVIEILDCSEKAIKSIEGVKVWSE